MGRESKKARAAQIEDHALVRNRFQLRGDNMVETEMRDETRPKTRNIRIGVGRHKPAVYSGDDVRILMGKEKVAQVSAGEQRKGFGQHPAVNLMAAGIEHHSLASVDNKMLIGLNGDFSGIEILQQDVLMDAVVVKNNVRHE